MPDKKEAQKMPQDFIQDFVDSTQKQSSETKEQKEKLKTTHKRNIKSVIKDFASEKLEEKATNTSQTCTEGVSINQVLHPQKKQFGRYKVISELGRGGMGCVYKAYDSSLEREVALKILIGNHLEESTTAKRFLREIKTTANLQHPNIITIYDSGCEEGHYFYAMDLIQGLPLDEFCKKHKPSINQIIEIIVKASKAMYFAHNHGVVHRDLKPANIMVNEKWEPVLMDFGLVKVVDASEQLSRTGTVIGTLYYMSPEQVQGRKDVDVRSDVYALGAIVYDLVVGFTPFVGGIYEVVQQIIHNVPTAPSVLSEAPKALDPICLKALEKKKEDRYQNAQEFINDLEKFLHQEKILLNLGSLHLKRKHLPITIISVVIVLIFVFAPTTQNTKKTTATKKTVSNIKSSIKSSSAKKHYSSLKNFTAKSKASSFSKKRSSHYLKSRKVRGVMFHEVHPPLRYLLSPREMRKVQNAWPDFLYVAWGEIILENDLVQKNMFVVNKEVESTFLHCFLLDKKWGFDSISFVFKIDKVFPKVFNLVYLFSNRSNAKPLKISKPIYLNINNKKKSFFAQKNKLSKHFKIAHLLVKGKNKITIQLSNNFTGFFSIKGVQLLKR